MVINQQIMVSKEELKVLEQGVGNKSENKELCNKIMISILLEREFAKQ